jgi:hypothetical protein
VLGEILSWEELYRHPSATLTFRGMPRTIEGPIATHHSRRLDSIILGLHYGAAYTQVAFAFENRAAWYLDASRNVNLITGWPEARFYSSSAVPSRIAYASENHNVAGNRMGYQVTPDMVSYSYTKPLLCLPDLAGLLADGDAGKLDTAGAFKLPGQKTSTEVVVDYLRELRAHVLNYFERGLGSHMLARTAFEIWITVPAIRSSNMESILQDAARSAGFASGAGDKISLITEPEAAALASFDNSAIAKRFGAGDCILVCDCGSTSTDLNSYTVRKRYPYLKLEECMDGMGVKVGTLSIVRNFSAWMQEKFGTAFTMLPPQRTGPGSCFIDNFEDLITSDFEGDQRKKYYLRLGMSAPRSARYRYGEVMITGYVQHKQKPYEYVTFTNHFDHSQELAKFYDPVVEQIIAAVDQQSRHVKRSLSNGKILGVILVGTLSKSPYLKLAFQRWKRRQECVQLILPAYG